MRTIVHLDADAFFASVEQAADSRLRGKAVAVGGEKRGIIASASYEARRMGIYTPMPTVRARKLCPKLIVLPGDFEKYERFSQWMFSYAYDFTPDVEQSSIDEGYFDLTAVRKPPVEVATKIRDAIGQSLKISVSEGIGVNKLVSQIASKLNKPAAFTHVPPGNEISFLHPLPNKWLPGIGPKNAERLNAAGLAWIGQIAQTPVDLLELLMGRQGVVLRQFANGIDERPLVPVSAPAKSYGEQQTFATDQTDEEFIEATLRTMADNLMAAIRSDEKTVRTLTVKVRYNDFAEDQCGESLTEPTDLETDLYGKLHTLLRKAWKRRVSVRMVSLKLSNIYDGLFRSELSLDVSSRQQDARRRLAGAVDELRQKNGKGVILRGHDFVLKGVRVAVPEAKQRPAINIVVRKQSTTATYVPLNVHSHYSFLDSTLSPAAIISLAKQHQLPAIALTDPNLHGAVEFFLEAKKAGVKPLIGAELKVDAQTLCLYVQNSTGYHNLCRLLSTPKMKLDGLTDGLLAVGVDQLHAHHFPSRFYRGVASTDELKKGSGDYPVVLHQPVHYATAADRWKFDVVQSIRTLTLLKQQHPEKRLTGEFHFRSPQHVFHCQRFHPELLANTLELADRCTFELPLGKPQFPAFNTPDGSTSRQFLRRLVGEGLRKRYPLNHGQMQRQVDEELGIIADVGYEDYFLVIWDILQQCRGNGIEWITRGSAADSLVCYCLGISDVCPIRFDLYFRRFLNKDRMALNKLPDIDIDFPHDRKDDVVDLIFARYGAGHCAVVGGFSTFQARSAFAEVAKVLGVAEREVRKFTEHFPWGFGGGWVPDEPAPKSGAGLIELLRANPETSSLPLDEEPYRSAIEMAGCLDGAPRYPKMHPCGVVLSRQTMHELTATFVSAKGYPTTHFDMDAVEMIGLVKMDVLAQGGLAVMRDAKEVLKRRGVVVDFASLEPWQDDEVWEMIASGGARAVHHIESPAMIGLCRMCNVRDIDGLIAIVSVIRPGAANEGKKVAFTRRYQGLEPIVYPHPSLEPCLRSTFGLVVYEEHILQICEAFAGLPPGRADVLRRALVKQKREVVNEIGGEFRQTALSRGHDEAKIVEVWELVTGFSGYAFCKAHSTAYGVEAYQAAWLKRYHPAEFMAAVLSNGKGFYDPLVYVLESYRLGINFLPPSINQPGPSFVVEHGSIRVPVTRTKGLSEKTCHRIVVEWQLKPFDSLKDFFLRVSPLPEEVEAMIRVGAFDCFGQPRSAQFWEFQSLRRSFGSNDEPGQGWLLPPPGLERLPEVPLQEPTRKERLQWEAELLGFPASGHPLDLHDSIAWDTYCPVNHLHLFVGQEVVTCGLVIEQRIHHQISGEPMKFLTLADRTGIVETELFADTYRSYGLATIRYPVLEIVATVEPFENGRGFSLRVHRAGKPRTR
jgi:error-prone DNA polymerase